MGHTSANIFKRRQLHSVGNAVMIITCSYWITFIYKIFIMHAGYVGTKYVWTIFSYCMIYYNLCITSCLIEYLLSVILQAGHPKCLLEFACTDRLHWLHWSLLVFLLCIRLLTLVYEAWLPLAPVGGCCCTLRTDMGNMFDILKIRITSANWVPDMLCMLQTSPAIWPGHLGGGGGGREGQGERRKKKISCKKLSSFCRCTAGKQRQLLVYYFVKALCLENDFFQTSQKG